MKRKGLFILATIFSFFAIAHQGTGIPHPHPHHYGWSLDLFLVVFLVAGFALLAKYLLNRKQHHA
jgi:hypothetical protein